jgi:hypothetical protein
LARLRVNFWSRERQVILLRELSAGTRRWDGDLAGESFTGR